MPLTRRLRRKYNLPLKGPTGLTKEEQIALSRAAGEEGNQKGIEGERRFLKAWEDSSFYPEWVALVRKATEHEDRYEKTDAVIISQDGRAFRVQIKTGQVGQERRSKFVKEGILLVQLRRKDTLAKIRRKTISAYNAVLDAETRPQKNPIPIIPPPVE